MITKSRSRDISNLYIVTGREHLVLRCTTPDGDGVSISIGVGAKDVEGREFVSISCMFDPRSVVELRQDMPQSTQQVIRLRKKN